MFPSACQNVFWLLAAARIYFNEHRVRDVKRFLFSVLENKFESLYASTSFMSSKLLHRSLGPWKLRRRAGWGLRVFPFDGLINRRSVCSGWKDLSCKRFSWRGATQFVSFGLCWWLGIWWHEVMSMSPWFAVWGCLRAYLSCVTSMLPEYWSGQSPCRGRPKPLTETSMLCEGLTATTWPQPALLVFHLTPLLASIPFTRFLPFQCLRFARQSKI